MSLRDGYRYEQYMTAEIGEHPDAKEAAAAFLEKRKPVFRDVRPAGMGRSRHAAHAHRMSRVWTPLPTI